MKVEITLSFQQLAGNYPIYIKGRKYWLVNQKQRQDLLKLKQEARRNKEQLQKLIDHAIERKT